MYSTEQLNLVWTAIEFESINYDATDVEPFKTFAAIFVDEKLDQFVSGDTEDAYLMFLVTEYVKECASAKKALSYDESLFLKGFTFIAKPTVETLYNVLKNIIPIVPVAAPYVAPVPVAPYVAPVPVAPYVAPVPVAPVPVAPVPVAPYVAPVPVAPYVAPVPVAPVAAPYVAPAAVVETVSLDPLAAPLVTELDSEESIAHRKIETLLTSIQKRSAKEYTADDIREIIAAANICG